MLIFSYKTFKKKKEKEGELKFIVETIELQKKQNWFTVNKLILNSSLAFNPQMRGIAGKS